MPRKLKFLIFLPLFLLCAVRAHAVSVTIASPADDDNCSLRHAIESANAVTGTNGCPDGIDAIVLPAGQYNLDSMTDSGQLYIDANLTITGAGSSNTTITQTDGVSRVFQLEQDSLTVSMTGLTITGGNVNGTGGGIENRPTNILTLTDVHVNTNTASGSGGGIADYGFLTLDNCQVNGNTTDQAGGGIFIEAPRVLQLGLKLDSFGKSQTVNPNLQLTVQNSTISGNHADTSAGGGIVNSGNDMVIDSSTISGNNAYIGGGIAQGPSAGPSALITNSTISGNTTQDFQPTGSDSDGGGIYNSFQDPLTLVNTTVSGNSAASSGGGIVLLDSNCGIIIQPAIKFVALPSAFAHFDNVTIAENSAQNGDGGGIVVKSPSCVSTLKLGVQAVVIVADMQNSIVADNTATGLGPDCSALLTSSGYNLIGTSTDCIGFSTLTNDILDQPSGLGALQNNGGPTFTQGLTQGSLAIDSANPTGCVDQNSQVLNRDQRGFARPIDATGKGTAICDRGAFEVGSSDITVTKVDNTGGQAVEVGNTFNYIMTVTNNGPSPALNAMLSDPVPSQFTVLDGITTTAGTCTHSGNQVNCQLGDIAVDAVVTITVPVVVASGTANGTVTNTVTVTTSTDGFQVAQTKQASTTTSVSGNNLLVFGSGCHNSLIPAGKGSPLAMTVVLLAAIGLLAALRVRRARG